ncbi:hypothetical protein BBJ28_00012270 [Nothophytophthora sp. Chile5]|nr:hypothetical protein BBJ28_00012270 [Nothophytophthora sp. Chile5]
MGKPLTAEQIEERRAKRAARRGGGDEGAKEQSEALFIEGSVRPYQRHYVVLESHNDPMAWPAKLERSPEHLVGVYVRAIAEYFDGNIKKSPLLVTAAIPFTGACNGETQKTPVMPTEDREGGAHDVMVFPELLRIHNVLPSQSTCAQLIRIVATLLLQWLKDSAAEADTPRNLWISSHYGGHRYAATCIVYPSGDWFGHLNDESKAQNLVEAIDDEDPLQLYELWRGRMGLTSAEMHQAVKDKAQAVEAVAENA